MKRLTLLCGHVVSVITDREIKLTVKSPRQSVEIMRQRITDAKAIMQYGSIVRSPVIVLVFQNPQSGHTGVVDFSVTSRQSGPCPLLGAVVTLGKNRHLICAAISITVFKTPDSF